MMGRFDERGLRILTAVALLLAVSSWPIRPTGLACRAPSPNRLPRNLLFLNQGPSVGPAMSARPSLREADYLLAEIDDELDAEIGDELTAKSPPSTVSFEILPSPCPEPHSERVGFAVAPAARPLRC